MKRVYCFLIFTLFILLGFFTYKYLTSSLFKEEGAKPVVINFKSGMSASNVVRLLAKTNRLHCPICLKIYVKLLPSSTRLQAGIYSFHQKTRPEQLIHALINGNILKQKLIIKAGQTNQEVLKALHQKPFIILEPMLQKQLSSLCVLCTKGIEGSFLAETYFYSAGSTDFAVLARSYNALVNSLTFIWKNRRSKLPYKTPQELLIAASIIEKETAHLDEKTLVSAVIVNRLRRNMRLQMDPTVIYGLGERYKYPLKKRDLRLKTPYNSYLNKGLPPTPICNVGSSALYAAAHPQQVDYLYFVATADGRHKFSKTLTEQTKAVRKFREHRDHRDHRGKHD